MFIFIIVNEIICVGFVLLCINVSLKDSDLSLKHVGKFISVDALRFYVNCLDLLVYVTVVKVHGTSDTAVCNIPLRRQTHPRYLPAFRLAVYKALFSHSNCVFCAG